MNGRQPEGPRIEESQAAGGDAPPSTRARARGEPRWRWSGAGLAAALALSLLPVSPPVAAHGDETHASKRAYDASQVEQKAFGREGDPKRVTRTVKITMSDEMKFWPATLTVKSGETVRFVVRNDGKALHEMVIGTEEELAKHAELMRKFPDMEHSEPHMVHVKPGRQGEMIWTFNRPGEFRFACLVAGHYEAGMIGKVVVK